MPGASSWPEFARAWALWLLCVPVVLLVLRARAGETRWTATIELWLRIASGGARARPGFAFEPSMLPLPLAFACAAVALAGPRFAAPAPPWRAHVDLRPQMRLEEGGRARFELALDSAEAWLAARGEEAVWLVDGREVGRGPRFPRGSPPFVQRRGATFDAPDLPGHLWIVDRLPATQPLRAGVHAAPRSPVPGLVDRRSGVEVAWDGVALVELPSPVPPPRVELAPGLEPALAALVAEWARARGLALQGDGELVLRVEGPSAGEERAFASDSDGVKLRGRLRGTTAGVPALAAGDDVLVAWRSGIVSTSIAALEPLEGDAGAFALRVGRTLDTARLEPEGCVPVAGRAGSGAAFVVEPQGGGAAAPRDWSWPWIAAALVLVWLGRRTI